MSNSYDDGRSTPDLRDDFADDDPGFITIQDGRLGLNKYSDNDMDDREQDCITIHDRRNTRSLPSDVPDPRFKQRSL